LPPELFEALQNVMVDNYNYRRDEFQLRWPWETPLLFARPPIHPTTMEEKMMMWMLNSNNCAIQAVGSGVAGWEDFHLCSCFKCFDSIE
jgi:hypothetical protein